MAEAAGTGGTGGAERAAAATSAQIAELTHLGPDDTITRGREARRERASLTAWQKRTHKNTANAARAQAAMLPAPVAGLQAHQAYHHAAAANVGEVWAKPHHWATW